jgi:hypothetical protein
MQWSMGLKKKGKKGLKIYNILDIGYQDIDLLANIEVTAAITKMMFLQKTTSMVLIKGKKSTVYHL